MRNYVVGGLLFVAMLLGVLVYRSQLDPSADPPDSDNGETNAATLAAWRDSGADPALAAVLTAQQQQLDAQSKQHKELAEEVRRLRLSLARSVEQPAAPEGLPDTDDGATDTLPADPFVGAASSEASIAETRARLISAGASDAEADGILALMDEAALAQLEARYRAYRQAQDGNGRMSREAFRNVRQLDPRTRIQQEFGRDAYDRYLYAAGQSNRVIVEGVMRNSTADRAGLRQGDVLLRYDQEAVMRVDDVLRRAAQGVENELVTLEVWRNGSRVEMSVPRGPLGFRGRGESLNPEEFR